MDAHPLSLYELNALVKRSITSCMPGYLLAAGGTERCAQQLLRSLLP